MARSNGVIVGIAVLAGAGLLTVVGSGGDSTAPLDPRSDAPLGTSALVQLLERQGATVAIDPGLPRSTDDVALLLQDDLDEDQAEAVVRWVERGGTLVVTDPSSPFVPPIRTVEDQFDPEDLTPGFCTIASFDDVEVVDGGVAVRYDTAGATDSCFGSRDSAFVAVQARGDGELVTVGGAAFATNERLDRHDNAVLATALLGPSEGASIRFLDAPATGLGGDRSLSDLVDPGVRRALIQLAIAFALFALWRAVRVGKPVPEPLPVEIAGSELVAATGRLLEHGRDAGESAEVLRAQLRRDLRVRYGVPPSAPLDALVALVSERTGIDRARVATAIGDAPVADESELVTTARAVSSIHQEVIR